MIQKHTLVTSHSGVACAPRGTKISTVSSIMPKLNIQSMTLKISRVRSWVLNKVNSYHFATSFSIILYKSIFLLLFFLPKEKNHLSRNVRGCILSRANQDSTRTTRNLEKLCKTYHQKPSDRYHLGIRRVTFSRFFIIPIVTFNNSLPREDKLKKMGN
jgi:hypothetical protein